MPHASAHAQLSQDDQRAFLGHHFELLRVIEELGLTVSAEQRAQVHEQPIAVEPHAGWQVPKGTDRRRGEAHHAAGARDAKHEFGVGRQPRLCSMVSVRLRVGTNALRELEADVDAVRRARGCTAISRIARAERGEDLDRLVEQIAADTRIDRMGLGAGEAGKSGGALAGEERVQGGSIAEGRCTIRAMLQCQVEDSFLL